MTIKLSTWLQEECRGWDVNELVFSPSLWGTYQPLMRADFTLFDSYVFQHAGEAIIMICNSDAASASTTMQCWCSKDLHIASTPCFLRKQGHILHAAIPMLQQAAKDGSPSA